MEGVGEDSTVDQFFEYLLLRLGMMPEVESVLEDEDAPEDALFIVFTDGTKVRLTVEEVTGDN